LTAITMRAKGKIGIKSGYHSRRLIEPAAGEVVCIIEIL